MKIGAPNLQDEISIIPEGKLDEYVEEFPKKYLSTS